MINNIENDNIKKQIIISKKNFDRLNIGKENIGVEYNISELLSILEHSYNYLGNEVEYIKECQKEQLSFVDCLYFSCITITTTGYGDVLPNNHLVRGLVSMEIVLGMLVWGIIIAIIADQFVKNLRSEIGGKRYV